MHVGVIGINHKSAELQFRDIMAKLSLRRFGPKNSCHGEISYILLTTCNRTEIYFSSDNLAETHTYLLGILRQDIGEGGFEHLLYAYFGEECFSHLARVTAGMDSAILGETEIQGQVKRAYIEALCGRKIAADLHFLFQKCLKIGKNIRRLLSITNEQTLEKAVLLAAEGFLGDLSTKRLLFVGISQINQKIYHTFKEKGLKDLTFCNRTEEKATQFALKENVKILKWEELHKWTTFDLALFATKSPDFVISKRSLLLSRKRRLIMDLSVPRNVDPAIGRHPLITLLNMDEIVGIQSRSRSEFPARLGSQFISMQVAKQVSLFQERSLKAEETHNMAAI